MLRPGYANSLSRYKAVFGIDTAFGLSSTSIPDEEWSKLEIAKQLFETVGYEYNQEEFGYDDENNDGEVDVFNPNEFDLNDLNIQPAIEEQPIQDIDKAANDLLGIRLNVRQNQEKQAEILYINVFYKFPITYICIIKLYK